jgi:hypothetical protein
LKSLSFVRDSFHDALLRLVDGLADPGQRRRAALGREGMAIVCSDDPLCVQYMEHVAAQFGGRRTETTVQRHWLGFAGEPRRFILTIVPPR